MDVPDVSYARSGDVAIAYHVSGGGEFDLVFAGGYVTHLTHLVQHPPIAAFFDRLSSLGRLIRFDRRGVGLSDRPRVVPTLEARMDDIRAVMEAAGSRRAALIATGEAGAMATLFAATYPERTGGLVLWNPFARAIEAPDYPIGESEAEWLRQLAEIDANWGKTDFFEKQFSENWPDFQGDEGALRWYCETLRCGASPGAALTVHRMAMDVDVRDVLAAIRVPVLILYRAGVEGSADDAGYMAERIPGAKCVAIPGRGQPWHAGADRVLAEIEAFLPVGYGTAEPDTVLSTVLFTDIVGSTQHVAAVGDRRWRETILRHDAIVRRCLDGFRGRELDTAGDGFFSSFDGPARAIRCAVAISDAVGELDIQVRSGLHTGECEIRGDKIAGLAVNVGARIAAKAAPGEVLVSSTVKDLVAGSDIAFEDRGVHELKGVPGEWRLYAVSPA